MRSLTILIVDNEAIVRNVMMAVLVHENYLVLEADSATEALRMSEHFEGIIDLLIADHTLKTMTGRQVAQHIRRTRPDLKVLHVSGYLREKLETEGGIAPDDAFLEKPFRAQALTGKVREILNPTRIRPPLETPLQPERGRRVLGVAIGNDYESFEGITRRGCLSSESSHLGLLLARVFPFRPGAGRIRQSGLPENSLAQTGGGLVRRLPSGVHRRFLFGGSGALAPESNRDLSDRRPLGQLPFTCAKCGNR